MTLLKKGLQNYMFGNTNVAYVTLKNYTNKLMFTSRNVNLHVSLRKSIHKSIMLNMFIKPLLSNMQLKQFQIVALRNVNLHLELRVAYVHKTVTPKNFKQN